MAPEEATLSAAEYVSCFPVPQVNDPAAAIDKVMSALRDGGDIEDAETKEVSIEFLDELKTFLECVSPGKTYRLICLRCESS